MTNPELHNSEASQGIEHSKIDPLFEYVELANDVSEALNSAYSDFHSSEGQDPARSWWLAEFLSCCFETCRNRFNSTPKELLRSSLDLFQSRWNIHRDELERWVVEYFLSVESSTEEASAEELLNRLADSGTPAAKQRELILQAEVTSFDDEQAEKLARLLYQYIIENRDSNNANDLVAVGSAIRKFVANLQVEEFHYVSDILSAEHRTPVPMEIELEVAKVVVRKLAQSPPDSDDAERELAARLMELVQTYLNPRLLSRQRYGATALNALLAILLLRARQTQEVIAMLVDLPSTWFVELVVRRASRLRDQLARQFTAGQLGSYAKGLDAALQALSKPNP